MVNVLICCGGGGGGSKPEPPTATYDASGDWLISDIGVGYDTEVDGCLPVTSIYKRKIKIISLHF